MNNVILNLDEVGMKDLSTCLSYFLKGLAFARDSSDYLRMTKKKNELRNVRECDSRKFIFICHSGIFSEEKKYPESCSHLLWALRFWINFGAKLRNFPE